MFKVKATVVGFARDESKYPCHFRHHVGDEIIYDGEKITGRLCPNMLEPVGRAFTALFASGGRHKEGEAPGSYYPFWHSPLSLFDPAYAKYDGVGFRATLERPDEGYVFVADETLFDVPPGGKYVIGSGTDKRSIMLSCGDNHTLAQFEVEAFDLADKGDALPYFRRSMTILSRVAGKPGIVIEKIIDEYTRKEIEDIYPSLGQHIVASLVGELELMGYVDVEDRKVTITPAGKKKLAAFKKSLTEEEKKALRL
jgi:uncharacterized repeat protein (TIGR04076 family)